MPENWLLDVQLAPLSSAPISAIWVADLHRKYEAAVRDHAEFYRSGKRLEACAPSSASVFAKRQRCPPQDAGGLLVRMVISIRDRALLAELADGQDVLRPKPGWSWRSFSEGGFGALRLYDGYPGFQDFAITLFSSA